MVNNPTCPATQMATNTITAATQLLRGTNIQVQDMQTTYAQSDYSNTFKGWGLQHQAHGGAQALANFERDEDLHGG